MDATAQNVFFAEVNFWPADGVFAQLILFMFSFEDSAKKGSF